jgi:hypothetical protein
MYVPPAAYSSDPKRAAADMRPVAILAFGNCKDVWRLLPEAKMQEFS